MSRFTIIFLVLGCVLTASLMAQPSPSVVAEPVVYSQALYYNHTSHIARTSDDKLFVVWTSSGTDGQIVYSQYDPVFMIWSPPAPISTAPSGATVHKAGIAADEAGNLYVAWQQRNTTAEDYAIYVSKYNGSSWSTPVNLTGNNLENEEVGIEVDDQGNVFVAWNTDSESAGDKWLLCLRSTDGGGTWLGPDTLSSPDGIIGAGSIESARPYLARGKNGKMVCTWFEVPDAGTNQEIYINQFDGSSWSGEQLVSGITNNNNRYPAAAIDAADNIYVVYRPFEPRQHLILKKKAWNDATWPAAVDTVVGQGVLGYKPFMTIDENDNLYVVYRRTMENDTTGLEQISYVTSTDGGTTWSPQTRLSREMHDGGYVTAASRIRGSKVDVFWREGYREGPDDPDSLSLVYGSIDVITSIEDNPTQIVEEFALQQNYPNPFNPVTRINYNVAVKGTYELSVFNLLGQRVRTLVSGVVLPGSHTAFWDGKNDDGQIMASGIYFYQLQGKDVNLSRKMMLIR
ncbi:MAG: T9SS C-terminal target domain-containing protein [Calditrichaeota bacterium]|nr:T9SS type A sorting domain-containing protein [Calditrichota bacterium]RQW06619.1 MAG: T9SS C-terminal target domain-containing protein [Calditrichota bacterium]